MTILGILAASGIGLILLGAIWIWLGSMLGGKAAKKERQAAEAQNVAMPNAFQPNRYAHIATTPLSEGEYDQLYNGKRR